MAVHSAERGSWGIGKYTFPMASRVNTFFAVTVGLASALSGETRFFAFVMERIDWQGAGFRKVETISARAGDDQAPLPSSGISWAVLAERYRRRSAQ